MATLFHPRPLVMAGIGCLMPVFAGCSNPTQSRAAIDEVWFVPQAAGVVRSRPAIVGNRVIFGAGDGAAIAREQGSGAQLWRTPLFGAGQIAGAEVLAAGNTVLVTAQREVAALDAATGSVLWRFAPPVDTRGSGLPGFMELSHPAIAGQTLFIPAWGATVSAVDISTGGTNWIWTLPRLASDTGTNDFRSGAVGVAVSGDTVLVSLWHNRNASGGLRESVVAGLDRLTGAQLWLATLPLEGEGTSVQAAPIVAGPLAVVATTNGFVYGLDRATRNIVWTFRSPGFVYATQAQPARSGDTIFVDGGDEKLYALRASTGIPLWSRAAPPATIDLLATGKRLYVSDFTRLFVLDKATGGVVATWQSSPSDALQTGFVEAGSQLFVTRAVGAWSFREP